MSSRRRADVLLAAAAAAALALAAVWAPTADGGLAMPGGGAPPTGCWLREATGTPCPTCGMTRSYVALAHGDVPAAFAWHPAGPALMLGTALALGAVVVFGVRRRAPLWGRRGFRAALSAVAWLVLVLGTLRYVT